MAVNKLEEKTYSIKELAEWFNIKPNTFSKSKQKYLQKLEYYARFHVTKTGKITIEEVFESVYTRTSILEVRMNNIEKDGGLERYLPRDGYTTLRDMASWYMDLHPEETRLNPIIKAFSLIARRDFGKYPKGVGLKGCRELRWVKVIEDKYIPLTEEEQKTVSRIYQKHLPSEVMDNYNAEYEDGASGEECWNKVRADYLNFLDEATRTIGYKVKTVTLFTVSAFKDSAEK